MRANCRGVFLLILLAGCERLEVAVVRVDTGPVESTVTSVEAGVVEPLEKASLASPVSGRIVKVYTAEGNRVKAGDVLIELENDHERLRVEETARELERLKKMKSDIATEEQFDRADFAHRRAKVEYEKSLIRATFPGIVTELNARVGEMTYGPMAAFSFGERPDERTHLLYVVNDSKLFVEAEIDETDVFRVKSGQPVKVTFGGLDRRTIRAKVSTISPAVSTQEGETRTAKVKVELVGLPSRAPENGGTRPYPEEPPATSVPARIVVGMSADIEILADREEDVVRVPTTAVLERGDEKYVFVVRNDRLERRVIVPGLGNWEMTQVREGLSRGDLVVLPADAKVLTDGRDVKATGLESPREGRVP